jgi:hypothetical protein
MTNKDERGTHRIRRTEGSQSGGAASSSEDSWNGVWLFVAFIAFLSLLQCSSSPPSRELEPPKPPSSNTATFRSLTPVASAEQIEVVLGGGSYELTYENYKSDWALQSSSMLAKDVFRADFNTGKTSGDPVSASTYILIGELSLQISQIGFQDSLDALIVQGGKNLKAYFNYANSERGPPSAFISHQRKRAIIIGTLTDLSFPDLRGRSALRANIIDLEPNESVKQRYEHAMSKYELARTQETTGGKRGNKPKPHVAGR